MPEKKKNKISDWMCPWTRSKYFYWLHDWEEDGLAVQSNGTKKNHFCCCGWSGRIQFRNSECLRCRVYDNFAPAARVSKLKLKDVWCKWRILRAKFRYAFCQFRLTFHHEISECAFVHMVNFNNSCLQMVLIGIRCWIWLRFRVSLLPLRLRRCWF